MSEPDATAAREEARPSLSKRIAPHLPFLRRYGRALTGAQSRGDVLVAATLETLISDPSVFPDEDDPRIGLYALFHRVIETLPVPVDAEAEVSEDEAVAARRLGALTPDSRRALLLRVVEGFSGGEAARVLGVSEKRLDELFAEGQRALKEQTGARVLIIEDEPIIAMDLETIVTDLGHSVTDIADTRATAVEAALGEKPDLVLADIQLADGSSGIDAVADILSAFSVPVIFITAYPERLLTGERPEPTYLITKPFRTETVEASISQALFFERTSRSI